MIRLDRLVSWLWKSASSKCFVVGGGSSLDESVVGLAVSVMMRAGAVVFAVRLLMAWMVVRAADCWTEEYYKDWRSTVLRGHGVAVRAVTMGEPRRRNEVTACV